MATNKDTSEHHSSSLGMNNPTKAQEIEFQTNIKSEPNERIVTLYSQDFEYDNTWEQICEQLGIRSGDVDKIDIYVSSFEINK